MKNFFTKFGGGILPTIHISFLILGMMQASIKKADAQCTYTESVSCLPEIIAPALDQSSELIAAGYASLTGNICIHDDLTINTNYSIANANIKIDANKKIVVLSPYTLTIQTSELYAATIDYNLVDYFQPSGAAAGTRGYGIYTENCYGVQIRYNRSTGKCGGGGCNNQLWSILTEDCSNAFLKANFAEKGNKYGIMIKGVSLGTNMNCNETEGDRGIGLNGLGGPIPPPIGIITGSTSEIELEYPAVDEASDNSWIAGGTYRLYAYAMTNCMNVNWRHQSSPSEFDLPSSTVFGIGGNIPPTALLSATVGDDCYSPYKLNGDETNNYIDETYQYWAEQYINKDDALDEINSYYMSWNYWNNLKIIDLYLLGDDLLSVYNDLAISNIPLFDMVLNHLNSSNIVSADEILKTILPINNNEKYWQIALTILIESANEEGKIEITAEDKSVLREIAVLNSRENGFGVHLSRTLLDTLIHPVDEEVEFRNAAEISNNIIIYPNPTNEYFSINNKLHLKEVELKLISLQGSTMLEHKELDSFDKINVESIPQGIYFIELRSRNELIFKGKLVINHN